MNILNEVINRSYPGADLSCRECQSQDVVASEDNGVSMANPLGERMMRIECENCGLTDEAIRPDDVRSTVNKWLVQTVRQYTCWFWFGEYYLDASTDKGIAEFKDGFWINADKRLSKASDIKHWIPPSKIDFVTVETKVKRLSE